MSQAATILTRDIAGAAVHRRHHKKSDGRDLFLYGYDAHDLPPIEGEGLDMSAGSELRRHPLRGTWSIYAANRNSRTFKPNAASDPLAPSQRGAPLTEIPFESFELCIFENRFPSLSADAPMPQSGPLETTRANGACEVVVYAPEGTGSLATLGQARRRLLLEAWIDRYIALHDKGAAFVLPFENRGEAVGITLHHPHGQIYGFPVVPAPQAAALRAFENGYDLAAHMDGWRADYAIAEAGGMMAYAPPFARFPYEVWISACTPLSGPWNFNETQSDGFAHLLGDMTARYDAFFGTDTPYMLSLHAAPYGRDGRFQFSAQFYPLLRAPGRVKYLASVEQSTGIFTVDVLPEQTAKALRDVI
ncbi:MAG: galactose-1-phosphate uridylyltransferase [Hyphomonadaceae bacterium]